MEKSKETIRNSIRKKDKTIRGWSKKTTYGLKQKISNW